MDDAKNKTSLKARIQKLGTALSGMVMPNIALSHKDRCHYCMGTYHSDLYG